MKPGEIYQDVQYDSLILVFIPSEVTETHAKGVRLTLFRHDNVLNTILLDATYKIDDPHLVPLVRADELDTLVPPPVEFKHPTDEEVPLESYDADPPVVPEPMMEFNEVQLKLAFGEPDTDPVEDGRL